MGLMVLNSLNNKELKVTKCIDSELEYVLITKN